MLAHMFLFVGIASVTSWSHFSLFVDFGSERVSGAVLATESCNLKDTPHITEQASGKNF